MFEEEDMLQDCQMLDSDDCQVVGIKRMCKDCHAGTVTSLWGPKEGDCEGGHCNSGQALRQELQSQNREEEADLQG